MQYMILIYEPETAFEGEAGKNRMTDIVAKHMALAGELRAKGIQKDGAGLQGEEAQRRGHLMPAVVQSTQRTT